MNLNLLIVLIFLSGKTKCCLKKVINQEFQLDQAISIIGNPEIFPLETPIYLNNIKKINEKLLKQTNQLIVEIKEQADLKVFKNVNPDSKIMVIIDAKLANRIHNLTLKKQFPGMVVVDEKGQTLQHKSFLQHKNPLKVAYLVDAPFVTKQVNSPGIMTSLLNLVAEKADFSLDYSQNCSPFQNELIQNGTISQLIKALINKDFDIAIGHLMMNSTDTTPFDFGPVLYNDILHFAGPKPQKLKSYKKLLLVFEPSLWIVILLGVLGMTLIYYFFALIDNFPKTHFLWTLIDVFSLTIGTGGTTSLKLVSFKILLFSYLIFFLSMDAIYLGNLSKIFATASYDIKLDNIVSLTASCKTYTFDWKIEKLLLVMYVTRDTPNARNRLKIIPTFQTDLLKRTALGHQNGTILYQSVMEAFPSHNLLLDSFIPSTMYLSLYVTYYLRKHLPYRDSILFWSQEVVEKGFVVKWYRDLAWENTDPKMVPKDEAKIIVLKLAHFEEIFRTLLIGYIMAFIVFCLELIYQKLEMLGFIQKLENFVWFLIMLLTPPNIKK